MSASDKKRLRKEENAQKMTARQQQEQKEAKKLKAYTIGFVSVMVAIVVLLVTVFTVNWYRTSGYAEKHTIAATIGDYEMNTVELAYYYNDAINEFYTSVYSSNYADIYFESLELDITKPLDKQKNPQTGETWATYFIDTALETAKSDFAMYNAAKKAGYKLDSNTQKTFDATITSIKSSATANGYKSADDYLVAIYGYGAELESYKAYLMRREVAEAYYTAYAEKLTYADEDLRAYEEDKANRYNSYTYTWTYLSYKDFLQGGTENEAGTVEYSEEENNAARAEMKAAAEYLLTAKTTEELREMITNTENVKINETSSLAVNEAKNSMYETVAGQSADLVAWVADEARTEGEVGMIEVTAANNTETSEETDEEKTVNGIYVLIYHSKNDNTKPMANVRHLLVAFEGGHTNDEGTVEYTEAEKVVTLNKANDLLKQWQEGEATEESFIALVKEHTEDTASIEDGGLYTDINPASEYEEAFRDWAVDPARQVGDVEIVETSYGYHIMYYSSDAEQNYRDYMITADLKNADLETFYNDALAAIVVKKKDLSKLNTALVIAG